MVEHGTDRRLVQRLCSLTCRYNEARRGPGHQQNIQRSSRLVDIGRLSYDRSELP